MKKIITAVAAIVLLFTGCSTGSKLAGTNNMAANNNPTRYNQNRIENINKDINKIEPNQQRP
jgi:PBP1b-binding outer membrane lipoprotein LpoB